MSFLKKISIFLSLALLGSIVASFVFIADPPTADIARAAIEHNVRGWAWSSNIGWISFNCTNRSCRNVDPIYSGKHCKTDVDCGGEEATCWSDCDIPGSDYGVNKETNGQLSGYAWSDNVGWISFNRKTCNGGPREGRYCEKNIDCPGGNQCKEDSIGAIGDPPATPYNLPTDLDYTAHYDDVSGQVTGWAKILNMGDEGWLKMNGTWANGVSISNSEFSGYAWNSNDNGHGIGWVSLNCSNESECGTSNYRVYINNPPRVENLEKADLKYCEDPGPKNSVKRPILRWEFVDDDVGDEQSAYELMIDDNADFSSPLVSTSSPGFAVQYIVELADGLDYDTQYYWRVRVWDNDDAISEWEASADWQPDAGFRTYKHEFPDASFTWTPENPRALEDTFFESTVTAYGGAAVTNWDWIFTDALPPASTTPNPGPVQFQGSGAKETTLTITDSDGYSCTKTEDVNPQTSLPIWKEVKPE